LQICDGLRFRLECPKSGGREGCQAEGNKELVTGGCARLGGVLVKDPDFQTQRDRPVEELEALNQGVIFYPKLNSSGNIIII
jgi:hypothetical protein